MRAIILTAFGSTDKLQYQELPKPAIRDDEVLVENLAIGINPVDIKTRKGRGQAARLRADPPMILGWDLSGVVVEAGKAVTRFKAGDEVFGMVNIPGHGKAYAEYVAAPASHLALKPTNITHEEAAAAPLAAMTAWQALVDHAKLGADEKILIHAASGGVGHYAVQIAKSLGAYVVGTSSSANRDMVLSLGADEHIDYTATPFEEVSPEVDVIIDAIGGDHIDRSLKVLKKGGRIISLPSGVSEDVGEKAAAQGKKGIFFLVHSNGEHMQQIASLLEQGSLRSHLSRVFNFGQISEAHDFVEAGKTAGKVVVRIR